MCMLKYLLIEPKKIFECFICFWKWFFYFRILFFLSKCIFVFFSKNWFRGSFARSSRLRASRESWLREINFFVNSYRESRYCLVSISWLTTSRKMFLGKNWKFFQSIQRLSQLSRNLFTTNSFSRKLLSFSGHSRYCIATVSLLPNLQKTLVFSFIT